MSDVHVVYKTRRVWGHLYQVCALSKSKTKEAAATCTSMLAVPFLQEKVVGRLTTGRVTDGETVSITSNDKKLNAIEQG